jgi:hypothetical protein
MARHAVGAGRAKFKVAVCVSRKKPEAMTDRSPNLPTATGDSMDSFSSFAVERLVLDPSAWTSLSELLEAYHLWTREKGMPKDATSMTFFRRLREWGGDSVKGHRHGAPGAQVKGYAGVRLKA